MRSYTKTAFFRVVLIDSHQNFESIETLTETDFLPSLQELVNRLMARPT